MHGARKGNLTCCRKAQTKVCLPILNQPFALELPFVRQKIRAVWFTVYQELTEVIFTLSTRRETKAANQSHSSPFSSGRPDNTLQWPLIAPGLGSSVFPSLHLWATAAFLGQGKSNYNYIWLAGCRAAPEEDDSQRMYEPAAAIKQEVAAHHLPSAKTEQNTAYQHLDPQPADFIVCTALHKVRSVTWFNFFLNKPLALKWQFLQFCHSTAPQTTGDHCGDAARRRDAAPGWIPATPSVFMTCSWFHSTWYTKRLSKN